VAEGLASADADEEAERDRVAQEVAEAAPVAEDEAEAEAAPEAVLVEEQRSCEVIHASPAAQPPRAARRVQPANAVTLGRHAAAAPHTARASSANWATLTAGSRGGGAHRQRARLYRGLPREK
jgi:hypothetical protein